MNTRTPSQYLTPSLRNLQEANDERATRTLDLVLTGTATATYGQLLHCWTAFGLQTLPEVEYPTIGKRQAVERVADDVDAGPHAVALHSFALESTRKDRKRSPTVAQLLADDVTYCHGCRRSRASMVVAHGIPFSVIAREQGPSTECAGAAKGKGMGRCFTHSGDSWFAGESGYAHWRCGPCNDQHGNDAFLTTVQQEAMATRGWTAERTQAYVDWMLAGAPVVEQGVKEVLLH